ncbi:MAG: hypothetical protein U9R48_11445 [Chloroflexota bacterium]|nr:hypothetical protein [Chloroflexota bacterium]
MERLDAGRRLGHRLLLLSAPAGFGKTTLLGEWISTCDVPVAWLSLDADDNDPVRFLSYGVGALRTVEEGIGTGILEMLQTPQRPDMEEFLTTLINQLNAQTGDLLLILDDYHLITETAVHEAVGFLLDHLPPSLCLVIAGRAAPPAGGASQGPRSTHRTAAERSALQRRRGSRLPQPGYRFASFAPGDRHPERPHRGMGGGAAIGSPLYARTG